MESSLHTVLCPLVLSLFERTETPELCGLGKGPVSILDLEDHFSIHTFILYYNVSQSYVVSPTGCSRGDVDVSHDITSAQTKQWEFRTSCDYNAIDYNYMQVPPFTLALRVITAM
jgi:hypothetical protein